MRACRCLVALLGVALVPLSGSAAQADIAPIPKPPGDSSKAPVVAPLKRPHVNAPAQAAPEPSANAVPATSPARSTQRAVVVLSSGGRDASFTPARSAGGREPASQSALARFLPTPLAFVQAHESMPSYGTWPPWLLAMFALLASAEAFLLTRIVRGGHVEEPIDPAERNEL
jgi:hypothetical protein